MNAQSFAITLKRPCLTFSALMVGTAILSAQPAGYIPPAAAGLGPPGAIQQPIYRPPTLAGNQGAYFPPGYTPPSKTKSTNPKRAKTTTVESKIAKLEKNDQHQDLRLRSLERDVGQLSRTGTIESGSYPAPLPAGTNGTTHTVKPGDTLWRIADKYSTSVNALRSANRLSSDAVAVGQTLLIPGDEPIFHDPSPAGTHIVKQGETFSGIASSYKLTLDALARANPSAYPDRLLIGEKLTIPGKKRTSAPDTQRPSTLTHTVRAGESLGAIAKRYGISTISLATANKLKNPNLLEVGKRLVIPGAKTSRTSTPPKTVMPQFPADSDTIPLPAAGLPEQPAPAPPPPPAVTKPALVPIDNKRGVITYRMERGDTLETVANLFSTTPERIRELNKLPADKVLKQGDELIVPELGAVSLN